MINLVKKVDESFLKNLLKDTNKEFARLVAIALASKHGTERLWQMKGERMHTIIIRYKQGALAVFKFYHADETIDRAILNEDGMELIAAEFDALEGENE